VLLKVLPYILGTLTGVYLNTVPIIPNGSTLAAVILGALISPMLGIPMLVALSVGRAIVGLKKTDSWVKLEKRLRGISKFITALMGSCFFSCSFFVFLQIVPLYLESLFKEYNPIQTPVNNWNTFHYYNFSLVGAFIWGIVAIAWPILSWIVFKWIGALSERIKFSDREERNLDIFQRFLSRTRKLLWLIYGILLAVTLPLLLYFNAWKGASSIIFDIFPWLTWVLISVFAIVIVFILLISLTKAFDWDKKALDNSLQESSEELHSSSK
jgi:hypothetical protein